MDHVEISVATRADMPDVWRLAHECYTACGYCDPQPGGELRHYAHLDGIPETTVFCATRGGILLGSVSVTLDSAAGLHVDGAFKAESDRERWRCLALDLTLAASWRIITKANCRGRLDVLRALVERVAIHLEMMQADRVLCTFNPKHARAWARLTGMEVIAGPSVDHSVNCAPAVLMCGNAAEMIAQVRATSKL